MISPTLITQLARPLRCLNRRSATIERYIEAELKDNDETSIRAACEFTGGRFGEFYHWYLQKLLVSRRIRGIDRDQALALIRSVDYTDYAQLSHMIDQPGGVLIAVPHHGHYIFSIIHLAEHIRRHRHVYVFYGQPSTHPGNEVFDSLSEVIWAADHNVEVIHDTRKGMVKAIRGLKDGGAVIIMPDVFKREESTWVIPFCGRPLNVMLGTAALSRKTGAWILPAVAAQHGRGMGFKTWLGERIDPALHDEDPSPGVTCARDYRVTRELFGQYEAVMSRELLYWQFVRQHLSRSGGFRLAEKEELGSLIDSLTSDPFVIPPAQIVDLRTPIQ